MLSKIGCHEVDVVGEILPRAANAGNLRLPAELALGADLAGHTRHLAGKRVQLIDHGVDGVFQLQNFAFYIGGDFAVEIAARHGRGHFRNVANLCRKVRAHGVHRIGEIFPGSRHTGDDGLPSQPAFGAHLTRHPCHFGSEGAQLLNHRVDGFFQLQDFSSHVGRDFLRQIPVGDRDCDFGDVAHLSSEVRSH